jgi:uncharacterized membrane protein SpoIIM required for sporulation
LILDLDRFLAAERPCWKELEEHLETLDQGNAAARHETPQARLARLRRLHYLYQRTSADLAKVQTFAAAPELSAHLEGLVARAYGEIHEVRKPEGFNPWRFFTTTFPRACRNQARAGALAVAVTLAGGLFGGIALIVDPGAKPGLIGFPHLAGDPAQRVAEEEAAVDDRLSGAKATFSSELMTHNIRVSVLAMALGITWGFGTVALLFMNGVLLGAVAADYLAAGQGTFLFGWLLPHGAIEIPAIVIAGQAGLVLAGALLGWADPTPLAARLRRIAPDLVALIGGVAIMLVWAGIVEAFLSQYHEPVLPYGLKIAFGVVELAALAYLLTRAGREPSSR